jgi:hypothetical protein
MIHDPIVIHSNISPLLLDFVLEHHGALSGYLVFSLPRIMPHTRPKASEMAAEAKRYYMPYIQQVMPQCPIRSHPHTDSSQILVPAEMRSQRCATRVAVTDKDMVTCAISLYDSYRNDPVWKGQARPIPIVNMANERRPGGDWESGLIAPEECLARRSNLVQNLQTPWDMYNKPQHYPIPQRGGLYSPSVGKRICLCYYAIVLSRRLLQLI